MRALTLVGSSSWSWANSDGLGEDTFEELFEKEPLETGITGHCGTWPHRDILTFESSENCWMQLEHIIRRQREKCRCEWSPGPPANTSSSVASKSREHKKQEKFSTVTRESNILCAAVVFHSHFVRLTSMLIWCGLVDRLYTPRLHIRRRSFILCRAFMYDTRKDDPDCVPNALSRTRTALVLDSS